MTLSIILDLLIIITIIIMMIIIIIIKIIIIIIVIIIIMNPFAFCAALLGICTVSVSVASSKAS